MNYDELLDVTGYSCPKPLLYTKKKLATLQTGIILCIHLDDRKSLDDFKFFCKAAGHEFLGFIDENPIKVYIKAK